MSAETPPALVGRRELTPKEQDMINQIQRFMTDQDVNGTIVECTTYFVKIMLESDVT